MNEHSTRTLPAIAALSPILADWWARFVSLSPELAARAAAIPVLIGRELPLGDIDGAPGRIAHDGGSVWFHDDHPEPGCFLRCVVVPVLGLMDAQDGVTVPFIERLVFEAVRHQDRALLHFAECVAASVRRDGLAGLSKYGIDIQSPVQVA